jgi:outer membrane biosynthesis protein TonB
VIVAPSIAPVSNDLSLDDDDMFAMRPKRRIGKIVAGVAVLGLAGLGFAVFQSGGIKLPTKLPSGAEHAAAASLTMPKASEATTPKAAAPLPVEEKKPEPPKAEEPKPEEPKAAADTSDSSAKKGDDRFSEEMKAALLAKDQKQAATQKSKKTARAVTAKARSGNKGKSSGGFKAGGSAYDPLNGKL